MQNGGGLSANISEKEVVFKHPKIRKRFRKQSNKHRKCPQIPGLANPFAKSSSSTPSQFPKLNLHLKLFFYSDDDDPYSAKELNRFSEEEERLGEELQQWINTITSTTQSPVKDLQASTYYLTLIVIISIYIIIIKYVFNNDERRHVYKYYIIKLLMKPKFN